jgi:hypothetical protein
MASQSSNDGLGNGSLRQSSTWGQFNQVNFLILQELAKLQTATLVEVVACSNAGEVSPVGFVDVRPMVNMLDIEGNPVSHETIFNVPYFRMQGGANAIIIDPQPGDIGIACFASRDISKIKSTRAAANPDSRRKFSFSDALYIGGVLGAAPTQYIRFASDGIHIVSPTAVKIDAPAFDVQADSTFSGTGDFGGDVTAAGISVSTHVHGGVQTGGSNTGGPM